MIESNTMVGTGMKVVCQREELSQKLGIVARAVSTRASVQILSGVLLRAEAGRLHLAATDMELSLRSSLEAQVDGDGELTVFARTQDVGEAKESLPVQFAGDPMEIGFNAEFLREGIESIGADDLRLKLISPLRPAVIEGDDEDPTYLIMPIRLP